MIFPLRGWICAGALSLVLHGSMAWSVTSDTETHHVAKASGQQVSVAGSLAQYMSTPQTLKVEPQKVAKAEPVVEEPPIEPIKQARLKPVERKPIKPVAQEKIKPVEQEQRPEPVREVHVQPVEQELQRPVDNTPLDVSSVVLEDVQPLKLDRLVGGVEAPTQTPVTPIEKVKSDNAPKPVVQQKADLLQPVKLEDTEPAASVKIIKTALLEPAKVIETKSVSPLVEKIPELVPERIKLRDKPVKIVPRKKPKKKKVRKKAPKKALRKKKKGSNKQRVASLAGVRGSKSRKNRRSARAGDAGGAQRVSGRAAKNDYHGRVQIKVRRNQRSVRGARRLRGKTVLRVTILRSGQVRGVRVSRSSGHPRLDSAALATVRRASPFSAFPREIRDKSLTMYIPFIFQR